MKRQLIHNMYASHAEVFPSRDIVFEGMMFAMPFAVELTTATTTTTYTTAPWQEW